MTIKQEKFCIEYIKSGNATEAYKKAFNAENMKPTTINKKAYELLKKPEIKEFIEKTREQTIDEAIIETKQRKIFLSNLIRDDKADISEKLKAIDLLNKMDGVYTQKVEHKGLNVQKIEIKRTVVHKRVDELED
jgi:phage terminase small subunit